MHLFRLLRRQFRRTRPMVDLSDIIEWNLNRAVNATDAESVDLSSLEADDSDASADRPVDLVDRSETNE